MILGIDWLRQHRSIKVNWLEQWVSFLYRGKLVKLKVKEEVAHFSMCEGVRVNKKLKSGSNDCTRDAYTNK
jgi:hypothetical protein